MLAHISYSHESYAWPVANMGERIETALQRFLKLLPSDRAAWFPVARFDLYATSTAAMTTD